MKMKNIKKTITVAALSLAVAASLIPSAGMAAAKWTPKGTDLRDRGVVTPVKNQNPWSTCWSFGTTAAVETSILSGEKTTYKKSGLDLSERHLIYFSDKLITKKTDPAQAGEGVTFEGNPKDPNLLFNTSNPIVVSSLFAQGVGPVAEKKYPYMGKKKMTQYEYMRDNKKKWKKECNEEDTDPIPKNALEEFYKTVLSDYKKADYYSRHDKWSLPEKSRNSSMGYVLKDGNQLPDFSVRDRDGEWKKYNKSGWKAIKREIDKGRGVSASYQEDIWISLYANSKGKWKKGEDWKEYYETPEKPYIDCLNPKTWAHYTPSDNTPTHEICIVGYDDNYPRKNFNKGKDYNGNSKTPPANGAWIVKNSYGSETEDTVNAKGRPIAKGKVGVKNKAGKHTGFIYISYYDKTISDPKSYVFGKDLKGKNFKVYQHDYMAGVAGFYKESSNKSMKSANVFITKKKSKLSSVGYRTQKRNSFTNVRIYRLGKKAKSPMKGSLIGKFTVKDKYAGFHRHILTKAVTIKKGQRISVVCTTYTGKKKKSYAVNAAAAEAKHKNYNPGRASVMMYGKAVVGKGQSYIFKKGKWTDWKEYKSRSAARKVINKIKGSNIVVDNFSIKLYTTSK